MSLRPFSLSLFCALALAACSSSTLVPTCTPACAAGQSCVGGACHQDPVDAGSGCHADSECAPGICTQATGACGPATCDPACPSWATCSVRTCSLSPGRCNLDADCPASLPICDAGHTCVAPALSVPSTPAWHALLITNAA